MADAALGGAQAQVIIEGLMESSDAGPCSDRPGLRRDCAPHRHRRGGRIAHTTTATTMAKTISSTRTSKARPPFH